MSKPLYVFAKFRAQASQVDAMKALLIEFTTQTLSEEVGCISYTYLQSSEDETLFTSLEVWQNAEAEAAHWETDHLKKLLSQLPTVMDGEAEVTKYHRI
ncbi:MAG TPA: antibiotic biosynthesis monooxygenase [Cytophagales bacterium]|nr:antibiotic biosynthesis monooxygenase [Cytophagales bacterium]